MVDVDTEKKQQFEATLQKYWDILSCSDYWIPSFMELYAHFLNLESYAELDFDKIKKMTDHYIKERYKEINKTLKELPVEKKVAEFPKLDNELRVTNHNLPYGDPVYVKTMEVYTLDHIKTPNGKKIEVKNGSASSGSAK